MGATFISCSRLLFLNCPGPRQRVLDALCYADSPAAARQPVAFRMTKRSLSELSDEDCSEYENGSDYENGPSENEAEEDSATLRELVRKKDAEISDLKAQVKKLKTEVKNAAGSLEPATNLVMGSEAAAAQVRTFHLPNVVLLAFLSS